MSENNGNNNEEMGPFEIHIGPVGSDLGDKQEMPLTGGYPRIERFQIEDAERTSSGKMVTEIVAVKKRLWVNFPEMLATDYDVWELVYETYAPYCEVEYRNYDDVWEKLTVKFKGNFSAEYINMQHDPWIYSNVLFELEEQ